MSVDRSVSPLLVLLDVAAHAALAADGQGRILHVNRHLEDLVGYSAAELVGQPVELLAPQRQREAHRRRLDAFLGLGQSRAMGSGIRLLARRSDGDELPVEVSLTPVPGPPDGIRVLAGIVDLTARVAEETRIRLLQRGYLTLVRLNESIVRAPDRTALFAAVCRAMVEAGGFLGAAVVVDEGSRDAPRPTVVASFSKGDFLGAAAQSSLDALVRSGNSPSARALHEGRSTATDDLAQFQAAGGSAPAVRAGVRSLLTVPLWCDEEPVAALTLLSAHSGQMHPELRTLVDEVSANVSLGVETIRTQERLRRSGAQRRELMSRLVAAQELERARIAGDLHDEPVQALAAMDLRLGLLAGQLRAAAPDLEPMVQRIQEMLGAATSSLRGLLFDLDPGRLEDGLGAAVTDAAQHLFEQQPVTWTLTGDAVIELPEPQQVQALRILKQALGDLSRRPGERTVRIDLRNTPGGLALTLDAERRDPGDEPASGPRGLRGVQTMQDRAAVTGGWCEVEETGPGRTLVRAWIPAQGA